MSALAPDDVFLFASFRLDGRGGLFGKDTGGGFALVPLGSRALDVLGVLVAHAGQLVSREAMFAAVWPGITVEDSNLNMQIAALRRVLDAGRTAGSVIQTIPGAATVLLRR
jgi:DNA-binding winged helix-turn-helix (wHTH) protein